MTFIRCAYTLGILCIAFGITACAHRREQSPQLLGLFNAGDIGTIRKQYDDALARAATEPGAVRTKSGVVYQQLEAGNGASPRGTDSVTVRYQLKDPDGTVVDDSASYGGTITVLLNQTEPCWHEGLVRMRVGGKSRLRCPPTEAELHAAAQLGRAIPRALDVTLVDVGRPLPPRGH